MKELKRSNGFSLIEVIIALFILAVALLALAGLMVSTTKNTSFGGHMTEASTFAQDKIEELKVSSWGNVVSGVDTRKGSTGFDYSRTWTVWDNTNGTQRWATVTVNWNDAVGHLGHSISFLSVIQP